jgi:hypothetical protein
VGGCWLTPPAEYPFPPWGFVAKTFDDKRVFAFGAAPGSILLAIIRIGATTSRTHGSYFTGGFFIQLLPVFVMPAWSDGHYDPLGIIIYALVLTYLLVFRLLITLLPVYHYVQ